MEYTVWFEVYGKKMKTTVIADSESDAKRVILGKVKFHKIEKVDNVFEKIMNIFNMKKP